jgi:hypothetical protein
LFTTNTNGEIVALNKNGNQLGVFKPTEKFMLYLLLVRSSNSSSSDNYIYAFRRKRKLQWKVKTDKAVLGNPVFIIKLYTSDPQTGILGHQYY